GSKLDHSFTNYVSDGNATCTADGTKTATCDNCTETDTVTDEGSKLDHSFTNYVSDGNATCTADGTKTATCDNCNATDTIADEGSKLDHTEVAIGEAKEASCGEDGITAGVKCSVCGEIQKEQEVIPATGKHTPGDAVKENETAESYESVVYCSVCRTELSREVITTGPAEPAVDPNLTFYSKELSLGADIRTVFAVKRSTTSVYDEFYLEIEHNGEKHTVEYYDIYGQNTKYYYFAYTLAAKQMSDELNITIYGVKADGTACISNPVVYSIKQGAIEKLDGWYGGDEVAMNKCILLANMLNYGAEAQKVFNYNLENLATDDVNEKYLALIKTDSPEMTEIPKTEEAGKEAMLYRYDLNLVEKVEIVPLYKMSSDGFAETDYRAEIEQIHINADGTQTVKTHVVEEGNYLKYGKYLYVYFRELASNEMRDSLTITLYKGEEVVAAVQNFSVESVCRSKLADYPALVPALTNYGDCAKVVFG
ncbi:MAG: hypothetical protein IJA75_07010, partial [Oscillospiraceae bacterium]|nr:hypothetical protein [Oscillospiraceae bacterium]